MQFVPAMLCGVGALVLVAAVAHALLRTFLEARGVRPWTLLDSLGASPMLLLGALVLGMSGGLLPPGGTPAPGSRAFWPPLG